MDFTMGIEHFDKAKHRENRLLRLCRAYKKRQRELLTRQLALDERNEDLAIALKEARFQLGRLNVEINNELETAQQIQEGLLPKELPATINLKTAAKYIPAGKVGGDLYDIIITPRQKIALLIYDVSGHGIPAALIGAMAKMLFAHIIEKTDSPAEVFDMVNRQLCNCIKTEQYLTAFLGIIDPINNIMTYSRAGHAPPLIYHATDGTLTRLDSKGFFIGHAALLPMVEYHDETINLDRDDKILFYTDGLTEGVNSRGQLYGSDRLRQIFTKVGSRDVNDIIDSIVYDQEQFRDATPLRDDFTMLCIQVGDSERLKASSGFSHDETPSILVANKLTDIDNVCSVILRDMDQHGFSDKSIKQFKICVFEMITNAILHGHDGDEQKKVLIFYKVTRYEAVISVVDEGPGFNYRVLPDPLLPENRTLDHGRGLFLILHYFDSVEFNEAGNRILGRKRQVR
jgi:serine phosphatase RsbU (regulator of sigma subunit)/anti-sigma regulatory factor (Ser/Thr protein kinase)